VCRGWKGYLLATYTAGDHPVILPISCVIQLDRRRITNTTKQSRKARTLVGDHIVGLLFLAQLTNIRVNSQLASRVISTEHILIDHAVIHELVIEAVRQYQMGVGGSKWQCWPTIYRDPFMRVTGVSTGPILANDSKKVSPTRVKSICGHFKARSDMAQPRHEPVIKTYPIFANSVNTGPGKY
jgi:hypothetical protein